MSNLFNTIGFVLDPLFNLFKSIWDNIVFFFSFLYDCIVGLYYGFNSLISNLWSAITNFFDLLQTRSYSFIQGYSDIWVGIADVIGYGYASVFVAFFTCIVLYYLLRFIFRLIPFFNK